MPDPSRTQALATSARCLGLATLLMASAASVAAAADPADKSKPTPPAATSSAPPPATQKSPTPKPKTAAPAKAPASEPVPKFTNDDLPKLSGAPADDVEEPAPEEPADKAGAKAKKPKPKAGEGEEDGTGEDEGKDLESVLGEEERAAKTLLLQRQIADAEKRLEQLESRRRALQNPLHAGLVKAGEDEQAAVGGQGNDVRLAWVEDQIRATRQAMARDREELASLQTTP